MSVRSDYSDGQAIIAYCLRDVEGTILAERNADVRFYSASTIKLAVMTAAIAAVEAGELSLDETFPSTHTFISSQGGSFTFDPEEYDAGMPDPGTPIAVVDSLRRMITVSSNEATNLLVQRLGFDAVNKALIDLGAKNSKMERLIGDIAALEAGLTHYVTAADLSTVMLAVVRGDAGNAQHTQLMQDWLIAQEYPQIGKELDEMAERTSSAVRWGSKSGWVTGIQHDVAFIEARSGRQLVLAVCTRGYLDDDAEEAIRAVTSALVQPHL